MRNTDLAPGSGRKHVWGGRLPQPQPIKVPQKQRRMMRMMGEWWSDESGSSVLERHTRFNQNVWEKSLCESPTHQYRTEQTCIENSWQKTSSHVAGICAILYYSMENTAMASLHDTWFIAAWLWKILEQKITGLYSWTSRTPLNCRNNLCRKGPKLFL